MSSGSENNENSSEENNMELFEEPQSDQDSTEASSDGKIVISKERWQCNFCTGKSRISFVTKKAFLDHVKWYHEFNFDDNEEQLNAGDLDQMNHLPTNMDTPVTPPTTPSTSKRVAFRNKIDFSPIQGSSSSSVGLPKSQSKKHTPKNNGTKRPRIPRRKANTPYILTLEDLDRIENSISTVMDENETLKREKQEALRIKEICRRTFENRRDFMELNIADKSKEIENLKQENQNLKSQLDEVQKKFATIQNLIGNK